MTAIAERETVFEFVPDDYRLHPWEKRLAVVCPVCGNCGKFIYSSWDQAEVDDLFARNSDGNILRTCSEHSLADVYRMYHPYQIRERKYRR